MYNKLLIISDNLNICERVQAILKDKDPEVTFATSPFSNIYEFENSLGCMVCQYDLRDKITVEEIVKKFDLVISAHCKQLFPDILVKGVKCINVHPGYNPLNRGWYPQVFAIINNEVIGATIHEIDTELDNGPIIARKLVEKSISDTSLSLYQKVVNAEIELFEEYIGLIIGGTYPVIQPETKGKLYLKKDFNNLCKIDMDSEGTFLQFYNHLRALSHGEFKNAYFIDPVSKKKIFLSLNVEEAE